ncbi:MAG: class I SAM-dependent methyltransferase family protein [Thermoplasmatales archaeon]|nr:MAG: class I SAM-dependent methyltransferase family protein [Thermoplasmatales archaeon]
MTEIPFIQIKKSLLNEIPSNLINRLPQKWEKIGDILTIVLPSIFNENKKIIGEKYAEILNCKTVLNDIGGIKGEFRVPNVELIYGSKNTETVHKENGVKYKLDPQKLMFSSGNMDERIRMANISNGNETVVDLFAGIGYFTLPIAIYSKPKKIIACEKNQIAFNYLSENIILNDVSSIVEPRMGDNREIAPKNFANRVIMGYIEENERFLSAAFDCLIEHCGIIHYHNTFPNHAVPNKPMKTVEEEANKKGCKAELLGYYNVKSYAPGINHYVFDLRIDEK